MRLKGSAVGACLAMWLAAAPICAEVEVSEQARALFRDGVALLKDSKGPRYAEAYEAFKAAYADSPSPKILGNIGLCATELERYGEALEAYRRYLDESGAKSERERKQILDDIGAIERRAGSLALTLSPGTVTVTDRRIRAAGEPVVNAYPSEGGSLALGLRAGTHRITIEAAGHATETFELEVKAGDELTRDVALKPLGGDDPVPPPDDLPEPDAEEDGGGLGAGVWVGIGVTGALGIATGVVGGLAASNFSDFEAARDEGDEARQDELRDKGKTLNLVGDVLLGTTIAAAAVTGVFLILGLTSDDEGSDVAMTVQPIVGTQTGGVALTGRF